MPADAPDVFVSYSRSDRDVCDRVVDLLRNEGFSVWRDREELSPFWPWSRNILSKAREAKCILVLWSERSVRSAWVKKEAAIGRRARKLVPAMIEPCTPPSGFRHMHCADLSRLGEAHDRGHPDWRRLMEWVAKTAGEPPPISMRRIHIDLPALQDIDLRCIGSFNLLATLSNGQVTIFFLRLNPDTLTVIATKTFADAKAICLDGTGLTVTTKYERLQLNFQLDMISREAVPPVDPQVECARMLEEVKRLEEEARITATQHTPPYFPPELEAILEFERNEFNDTCEIPLLHVSHNGQYIFVSRRRAGCLQIWRAKSSLKVYETGIEDVPEGMCMPEAPRVCAFWDYNGTPYTLWEVTGWERLATRHGRFMVEIALP